MKILALNRDQECEHLQSRIAKACNCLVTVNQAANFALWLEFKCNVHSSALNGKYRIFWHKIINCTGKIEEVSNKMLKFMFSLYKAEYPLFNYMH